MAGGSAPSSGIVSHRKVVVIDDEEDPEQLPPRPPRDATLGTRAVTSVASRES
jgi:hypothetical protein